MRGMTISALARAGGVGVETVRFYQRRGLMPVPEKSGGGLSGGIRRYGPEDARRLRFIRAAQASGFSLVEIGELLALDSGRDHGKARRLASTRIAALDETIARLTTARDSLQKLAEACARADAPCPIIAAFEGE
jgi:MerR family transcriptional regulator, mercuric resistance operon regulatory protein